MSASRVRRLPYHFSFDVRPTLLGGATDSNSRHFRSAVATVITAPEDCECTLHMFDVPHVARVEVNGAEAGRPGEPGALRLKAGDNLVVIDTSTLYHHFWIAITLDEGLTFRAPGGKAHFAIIGPYKCRVPEMPIWGREDEAALLAVEPKMQEVAYEHEGSIQPEQSIRSADVLDESVTVTNPHACCWPNRDATVIEPVAEGEAAELLIDFGRELVGFIEFEVHASEGTMLEWDFFESIQEGRRQPVEGNTIRYVCREGPQSYLGIVRHGFRYAVLHVSGATRPTSIRRVLCHLNTYPVTRRGWFECSDDRLNRIYEMSAWTTRLCTEDTFVDCPAFEQTFWVGDARNEALITYTCFGGYDIVRRCLELVPQSMFRSPIPEGQTPSGWQSVLTAWALFWGMACAEYYGFTGETDFVEGLYPELRRMNEACLGMLDEKGLFSIEAWNMLDWAPMDTPNRGVVTHQNCELVATLRTTARLAETLRHDEDARRWREAADALAEAINANLWDEEKRAYVDCLKEDGSLSPVVSQQTNTMAYLCGVVPDERLERVTAIVREAPEGFVRIGSPFMMFFSMEALARLRDFERIVEWTRKWWGLMLDAGATSCWET
ncbi:MAG: family 78 glycoside hydrolase catalytic domain, partial [Armatimonadota bacterium]